MPGERERRLEATRRRSGLPYHRQGSRGVAEGGRQGRATGTAGLERALRIEHAMKINDYDIDIVVQGFLGKIGVPWRPGLEPARKYRVPGHDVPMVLENGQTKYIDKREGAISACFGKDMETTTLFKLTV